MYKVLSQAVGRDEPVPKWIPQIIRRKIWIACRGVLIAGSCQPVSPVTSLKP